MKKRISGSKVLQLRPRLPTAFTLKEYSYGTVITKSCFRNRRCHHLFASTLGLIRTSGG